MSEITNIEKIDDDNYKYDIITTKEEQISVKHLNEEKIRLQERIIKIDFILAEIAKIG